MTSIIEKIKKLRALATSSNVNEAAAAAAAAERLIQEHAISEEQLVEEDEKPVAPTIPLEVYGRKPQLWKVTLVNFLAKQYRCASWRDWTQDEKGQYVQCTRVTGRPSDIEILKYQAAYFTTEIARLVEKHCKGQGKTFRNSFAWGAVEAIQAALRATEQQVRAQATSTALARIDGAMEAALELRAKIVPSLRTKKSTYRVNAFAKAMGQRAGAGINQRSQLGGSGARLLGTGT